MEKWQTIPGIPSYEVSSFGRIRHIKHKKIRKLNVKHRGYIMISLGKHGTDRKTYPVHRLVAQAFLNCKPYDIVDHINRNREDNNITNLRVTTSKINNLNRSKSLIQIVDEVIAMHCAGLSKKEIARRLAN